jgi:hypothetical protein
MRGGGTSRSGQSTADAVEHAFGVAQHLVVPDAQDALGVGAVATQATGARVLVGIGHPSRVTTILTKSTPVPRPIPHGQSRPLPNPLPRSGREGARATCRMRLFTP